MSPSLIIAAPSSGQGKTLFTFGLLRALKNKGLNTQPFKVGPDYIDPRFHEAASGNTCFNLDPWAMKGAMKGARLSTHVSNSKADINIIEGVMGLFDGAQSTEDTSTAALAIKLGVPVILVVDCKGMAQSVAALVHGFKTWNPQLNLAGIVLNRVASPKHEAMLKSNLQVPVFGCLPVFEDLKLESRHLGLVQAGEIEQLNKVAETAAKWVSENTDLDALTSSAGILKVTTDAKERELPTSTAPKTNTFPGLEPGSSSRRDQKSTVQGALKKTWLGDPGSRSGNVSITGIQEQSISPLGRNIAIARDQAFAFAYPHLLDDWRKAGADLIFFSPLANEAPDLTADAVFLPGGYPELYAEKLAANTNFLDGLRAAKELSAWIYGECGGFMVLGESLIDREGKAHKMAGLLPVTTSFAEPKRQLGYREFTSLIDTPLGPKGSKFRGHEFHFSSLNSSEKSDLFSVQDATGADLGCHGLARGKIFGSYMHLIDIV